MVSLSQAVKRCESVECMREAECTLIMYTSGYYDNTDIANRF